MKTVEPGKVLVIGKACWWCTMVCIDLWWKCSLTEWSHVTLPHCCYWKRDLIANFAIFAAIQSQFSYFLATKIYSLNLYHYCPALFSEILSVHHTMSHIRQHHDNVTVCIQTICREKFHAEYIGHKLSQHWWDYSVADNGSWKHMKNSHTVISAQL